MAVKSKFSSFRIYIIPLVLLACGNSARANDTLKLETFMELVSRFHPIARQAANFETYAYWNTVKGKGAFDPKIEGSAYTKFFQDKNYYELGNVSLKAPLLPFLDFNTSYNQNNGQFLNPQEYTPSNGLSSFGFTMPLLNGLFFNERLLERKTGQLKELKFKNEADMLLNQLMQNAYMIYWQWSYDIYSLKIYQEGVALAQFRLDGIKQNYLAGANAAIDTLEAYILWQNRQYQLQSAQTKLNKTIALVQSLLWDENNKALNLKETVIPQSLEDFILYRKELVTCTTPLSFELDQNPLIVKEQLSIKELSFEKRYLRQQLLPELNYKRLWLGEGSPNQFRWNNESNLNLFQLSFPVFLRKERANLRLKSFEIQNTELSRNNKMNELQAKLAANLKNQALLFQQVDLAEETVINQSTLLKAETTKFFNGESSLFLVNTREMALIQTQIQFANSCLLIHNNFSEIRLITAAWLNGIKK